MPIVQTTLAIPNVELQAVWQAVSAFDKYPETMESVLSVDFLERSDSTAISSWRVSLNGSELAWIEKDTFEPYGRIVFDSIDGDLEVFRGQWVLSELSAGVSVTFEVEFDLGIPSLAEVLNPVGVQALEENSRSMLLGIGRRFE